MRTARSFCHRFTLRTWPSGWAKRAALAAVCHADNTGRLHTVRRAQNTLYYDLIRKFAAKSGVPVVLNTSFNENEPIVDTPEQAVQCFVRTDSEDGHGRAVPGAVCDGEGGEGRGKS